jgi:AcrR family transcriptional regulator
VNDRPGDAQPDRSPTVRNEPVQARSAARLEALLDAAAAIVDEVGYERLTTAMVAERAGASIGTVYRYYPDRIALLRGLSGRSFQRYVASVAGGLDALDSGSWVDAVNTAVDAYAQMFRTEPGFRAIRFGDTLDLGPEGAAVANNNLLAREIARTLAERFPASSDELLFALEVAVEMMDALLYRAFSVDPDGDERFIEEARVVMRDYLTRHLPVAAVG